MPFRVALTFDTEHPDRPASAGNTERLLDTLAALGIGATFFVQGRWAEAYPAIARRIAAEGHLVGSHSHYHVRMSLLSPDGFDTDVRAADAAIREYAGVDPKPWFRLPFGAGGDDPALISRLDALGYHEVGWDVNPEDWRFGLAAPELVAFVVDGALACGDGVVVLQHSWPDPTAPALFDVVARLRDRDATFVGVDELDRRPNGHPG